MYVFFVLESSICCLALDSLISPIRIATKHISRVTLHSIVSEKDKNCYTKCKSCHPLLRDHVLTLHVPKRGRGSSKKLTINGHKEHLNDL